MKVQLEKSFDVPASGEVAWQLLQDMQAVAGCMPGATITEKVDDAHYKGTVAVKLGPAALSFRGEIRVLALDTASRSLRLAGKGTDTTGGSGAAMELTARVEAAEGGASRLVGMSEVSMSGKAAAFGARLMNPVAEQVLSQFAANFAARALAMQEQAGTGAAAAAAAAAVPPAQPLNVLSLLCSIVRSLLRSVFGTRRT